MAKICHVLPLEFSFVSEPCARTSGQLVKIAVTLKFPDARYIVENCFGPDAPANDSLFATVLLAHTPPNSLRVAGGITSVLQHNDLKRRGFTKIPPAVVKSRDGFPLTLGAGSALPWNSTGLLEG